MKRLGAIFLFIFLIPSISFAANISGTWVINGTGYIMTIKIAQNGNNITGNITGGGSSNDTITGTVSGNVVTFSRTNAYLLEGSGGIHPQVYKGFLFARGPQAMAGTFKHKGSWNNGWYGNKQP